jgi:hypothetical protein
VESISLSKCFVRAQEQERVGRLFSQLLRDEQDVTQVPRELPKLWLQLYIEEEGASNR